MQYQITENNIHIVDSYKVTGLLSMVNFLNALKSAHPECKVFNRSISGLIREWRAHNRLYKMHLFRSHTKDVDLNFPMSKLGNIFYSILGY